MKVVLQRVTHASVTIDGKINGQIEKGYMALVGIHNEEDKNILKKMAEKVVYLRVFEDDQGKMNRSLLDIQGKILSIPQFTLYADTRKGRRPSFINAGKPSIASSLYDAFNEELRKLGVDVEVGIFGADMKVELLNDGPVTIILDSDDFS